MSIRNSLADITLLSDLDDEALQLLEKRCRFHEFGGNQTIFSQADTELQNVFFILEGTVRIVNHSRTGREIAFANIYAGGYFGDLTALTGKPRSATVVAVSKCRLASISALIFKELLLDHPKVALRVIGGLANIVQRSDKRIMDLSTLSAVQRVHAEILHRVKPGTNGGDGWAVSPLPKHDDIASHASTTRETVVRAMKILSVAGIASRKGRRLEVFDFNRLEKLVKHGHAQVLAAR